MATFTNCPVRYRSCYDDSANNHQVFPSSALVMGFQYKGQISSVKDKTLNRMASAGISGISDSYKVFKNSDNIGTILVYFSDVGFTHFS